MSEPGSKTGSVWSIRGQWSTRLLGLLVVAMAVAYGLAFPLLLERFGIMSRVLSLIYILLAAWAWGMRWGVLVALLNVAYAIMLFRGQGQPLPGGPLGPVTSVVLAALVGRLRDISGQLRKELHGHRRVEEELAEYRDHLKDMVARRTGELKQANDQLRQEIAERRQVEENLKASEEKYRLLAETISDNIWIMGLDDLRFTYVSPSVVNMHGFTAEEALKIQLPDLITPASLESALKILEEELAAEAGGADPSRTRTLEMEQYRLDGSTFWTEVSIRFIRDDAGHPQAMLGVTRDISERKRLQAQLQQVHKMEAVGILAGGIAHDFNNLLQIINGFAEFMLTNKTAGSPDHRGLTAILKSSARAARLIQQLLLYSRKAETEYLPLDLSREVEESVKILERALPKMIDIEFHTEKTVWTIRADHMQIEQVLLNLGSNAADAMPDGGRLILETGNVILDEAFCQRHLGAKPGPHVLLTVSDTGQGMDPETVEHVFEPFFTTKDIGKGTGLGLASVFGIVKNHGGYILCYSEAGHGTAFKVYFPACENTPEHPHVEKDLVVVPVRGGEETILVVDDEQDIRDFASQVLQNHGYRVVTASSGEQALEVFAGGAKVDLVILDLGMPGMGGRKCLGELLSLKPSARVIIASGYSINGQAKESMQAGAVGFIGKPYRNSDLLKAVRLALGAH
jgi:PAS domain S-box-containing protein